MSERLCNICGNRGPFGVDRSTRDGLRSICKPCTNDRITERRRNPEVKKKRRDIQLKYEAANVGKLVKYRAEFAQKNKPVLLERASFHRSKPGAREKATAAMRNWAQKNPDLRRNQSLKKYGLNVDDYRAKMESQNNSCELCGEAFDMVSKQGKMIPVVDHCHETGRIRGIIHSRCNLGIGLFGDDPSLIERAVSYLKKHGKL